VQTVQKMVKLVAIPDHGPAPNDEGGIPRSASRPSVRQRFCSINAALHTSTILFALFVLSGCDASRSPTAPSTVSLIGTVTAQDGARVSGATVRIGDGLNAGKSTATNNDGEYRFDDLAVSNGTVSVVAEGYESAITRSYIDGMKPLDFTLRTRVPWSVAGTGNARFDIPSYVTGVHVIGVYTGVTSTFIVHVGNCVIVEDQLGTGARRTISDGTYPVTPALTPSSGVVEIIVDSPEVSWSLTEDRRTSGGTCFGY
jgi:Carboxypeptidase regulatory-like domain